MRHQAHIEQWVVIDGVRTSYRGYLLGIEEYYGDAILRMHPCYALEALADTKNEVKIETSPDAPWEIYSQAILGIGRQPKSWPRR